MVAPDPEPGQYVGSQPAASGRGPATVAGRPGDSGSSFPCERGPRAETHQTQAGNLSLKKLTKTEAADFYKLLVCGHILLTLREAFAVVPRLTGARIIAVRASEHDAYGRRRPEVIAAARCQRQALHGIRWTEANAARIFNDAFTDRIFVQKGATAALQPIDLTKEPDLAAVLAAIDMSELLDAD